MPEGDTIFRTAVTLRRAIEGQVVRQANGRPELGLERLVAARICSIEARGKHLLIHSDRGLSLHSHMGMTGSWHIYRPAEPWQKPAHRAHATLDMGEWTTVCFTPKTIEMLSQADLRAHPFLRKLGPDILAAHLDLPEILRRLRIHNAVALGEAIMNQTIVCGIGNVYKSEVLFLERLDPFAAVATYTDDVLLKCIERAAALMVRNLDGPARRTRFRGDKQRLWAYGRVGQACFVCGGTIQMRRQGDLGRTTFWCPACIAEAEVCRSLN